jgi:hypothetical protein
MMFFDLAFWTRIGHGRVVLLTLPIWISFAIPPVLTILITP